MNKQLFSVTLFFALFSTANAQLRIGFINDSLQSPNELSVAANPLKPGNWVVGANINQLYITQDSGLSWKETEQKSSLGPYGDPVILADSSGIFYHAHLSKTPGKPRPDYLDRMIVQRSSDGGLTWNDGVGVGFNQGKVQDKEWLSVDQIPGSPYKGTIYMSWTEFDVYGSTNPEHRSRIRFTKSSDQGLHFSNPIIVSDSTGDCQDDDNTLEGATTAVGPNGEIYIVWAGQGKIWFDKSLDGGNNFGKDMNIGKQTSGWTYDVPGIYRSNAMPFIQCNHQTGELFIVYTDSLNGSHQLILLRSKNKGKTWEKDIYKPDGGKHIFFPNMEINSETGKVAVLFYQNNSSQDSLSTKLLLIGPKGDKEIIQIGPSFPIPGKDIFFGDYIDLCLIPQGYVCVWTSYEQGRLRARYGVLTDK